MVPRRRCKASVASGFAASEQASLPVASPTVVPVKDPFAERVQYNDSWLDLLFITVFTRKMAGQLDGVDAASDGRSGSTWDDFVRVSKGIMVGRNSVQQRSTVRDVLMSLFPPGAPAMFRRLFPPTKLSAELNARFASIGFVWLVGKMEVRLADVQVGPNEVRQQHSVVHIEKCRYLESSGCVGMCTNMCKVPTQKFFCDEFGLPLTLVPNFEDLSCDMIFGQAPPARLEDDPVYGQPCFPMNCSIVVQNVKAACPKTDTATLRKAVPASVVAAAQAAELKTALAAAAEAAARRAGMKA